MRKHGFKKKDISHIKFKMKLCEHATQVQLLKSLKKYAIINMLNKWNACAMSSAEGRVLCKYEGLMK